jgi:hypothetical protein
MLLAFPEDSMADHPPRETRENEDASGEVYCCTSAVPSHDVGKRLKYCRLPLRQLR